MTVRIVRPTIGEAHDAVMKHLLSEWLIEAGGTLMTEDNELTFESPGMTVHVTESWRYPKWSPALQFGQSMLEQYVHQLTGITSRTGTNKDFEYTYGNRIFDYPRAEVWRGDDVEGTRLGVDAGSLVLFGDGDGKGLNQVATSIIERLKANPSSRRAIAVTWVAEHDMYSRDPPCLQFIQCLVRDRKVNLHAVFRSHDMAGGWGPNAYALQELKTHIVGALNGPNPDPKTMYVVGYLETYSVSAHIYLKQDQVQAFRKHLNI